MPPNNKYSLGELESEIMEVVWDVKKATVRNVLVCLQKKREIAYTTVMTIMGRLHCKGLLNRREDKSGAFVYSARENKDCFCARVSEKMIENLIKNFGDVAVAQFINILDRSDLKKSAEWRKKLKNIR